ncbi:hypothetical protein KEJ50_06430 [Candidatus Bathyarchaeota archaeon]|nr:hypothetical protein [Candidatus Bathyarchaeota archaeon]
MKVKEELKKPSIEASFKEVFPLKEPYAYGAIDRVRPVASKRLVVE